VRNQQDRHFDAPAEGCDTIAFAAGTLQEPQCRPITVRRREKSGRRVTYVLFESPDLLASAVRTFDAKCVGSVATAGCCESSDR
jgi:hypothetical protein